MQPWLDTALTWLSFGWIGSLLGATGIAVAVLTYLWTRQRSLLVYQRDGNRLLGGSKSELPRDVTVLYQNDPISALSRSVVVMWNAGEKTIGRADLATTDPLRVEVGDKYRILSASVVGVSRPVVEFACAQSGAPHTANLAFEFLDTHDGAIVEILHTDDEDNLVVAGTVRGIPKGLKYLGRTIALQPARSMRQIKFAGGTMIVLGLVAAALAIFASADLLAWPFKAEGTSAEYFMRLLQLGASIVMSILGCVLLHIARRRHPKSLSNPT
jgi:hypothetical protein